jgi:hypothetical protein
LLTLRPRKPVCQLIHSNGRVVYEPKKFPAKYQLEKMHKIDVTKCPNYMSLIFLQDTLTHLVFIFNVALKSPLCEDNIFPLANAVHELVWAKSQIEVRVRQVHRRALDF